MLIKFEGNKLEYGMNNVLTESIKFDIGGADVEGFYRADDVIIDAYFDDDEDITIRMKSGDIFILVYPFEPKKCKVKKIKDLNSWI